MKEIIGVRFRPNGKIYFFSPGDHDVECGQFVIVETARGVEFGKVVLGKRNIDDGKIVSTLKTIIRVATDEDKKKNEDNKEKSKKAFVICKEKIAKHKLDMKVLNCEYTLDRQKLIIYFESDGRVDFRDLVKDLAEVYRTRIELRQVGSRDGAKVFGGIGPCGLVVCCQTFLTEFANVSVKMAKNQSLSLNPLKISGNCGKLLCCINYENDVYTELRRNAPDIGDIVSTEQGEAKVLSCDVLNHNLKVKYLQSDGFGYLKFEDVKIVRAKKDREKENNKELKELL